MSTAVTPTVGRKVWYYPSAADVAGNFGMKRLVACNQPLDATIVAVHSDMCVNLHVIDHTGKGFAVMSAMLFMPESVPPGYGEQGSAGYAAWMPYQVSKQTAQLVDSSQSELIGN